MNNDPSFVVVGDVHIREDAPVSRTDNVLETICSKLAWVVDYTNKNADALIFLGDLGERPIWSSRLVNRTCKILEECTKPMYTLIGNHDIKNYNKDYELWEDTGLYRVTQNTNLKVLRNEYFGPFHFYGFSTVDDDLEDFVNGKFVPDLDDLCYPVSFAHYPVGNYESQWMRDHKKLRIPYFTYQFYGDIHDGFEPCHLQDYNTIVANPGALFRKSKAEIGRKIQVYHVNSKQITKVPVPHKKGTEVFVETLAGLRNVEIPEYMDDELVDPGDMSKTIYNIAQELKVSKEATEYVLKRYQEQRHN